MTGERQTDWDGGWKPPKDDLDLQIEAFERAVDSHPLFVELSSTLDSTPDVPPAISWD